MVITIIFTCYMVVNLVLSFEGKKLPDLVSLIHSHSQLLFFFELAANCH